MQLDMPLWLWLLALLTALLASAITTITSIGAGLITYGVLGFFADLKTIIPILAPAQLLAVLARFWLFRKDIQWHLAITFFIGVIPGIVVGTWLFHLLTELALRYSLVREALVAMMSLFFLIGNSQRALLYWQEGLLTADSLSLGCTLGLAMIAGVYVGRLILPHLSRERFVHLVLAMLILFGMKFLVW